MARAGLTPKVVTLVAADLADAHGWQQLTLAAVAAELGVRQPSLYKHIASLAALRRTVSLLAIRELGEMLSLAVAGRAGCDALTELAKAYRGYSLAHPGRYAASIVAPRDGDTQHLQASQAVLATLAAVLLGYDIAEDQDVVHAIRAMRALLHGFVDLELAGGFALEVDLDESFSRLVAGFDVSLREQVMVGATR